ncbi:DUF1934 domain-containing protein [Enterococcus bulliens]
MAEKQGQAIAIHLETIVQQEGETQNFVFDLTGQLVKIGDTLYIRYKEETEEGQIPVTIKLLPDGSLQLIRASEMRLRLKFEYKQTVESHYKTPYGMMFFSTFTHDMHVSLKDRPNAGEIALTYDLYLADQKAGEYQMKLSFTA